MKLKLLVLGSASFLALTVTAAAQVSLPANSAISGRIQWAPANGPTHLGGGGAIWGAGDGNNFNDIGDLIVGDGGANQNFGITLAIDTTSAFRSALALGNTVTLSGSSLFGIDDGFGTVVQKTVGNVSWSKILVTLQAYGSSTTGSISDSDTFALARSANLSSGDVLTNTTYAYAVGPELIFDSDPYLADATFSVDITSLLTALPLSSSNDRVMIGIFAYSDDGLAPLALTDSDSVNDRIAFESSSLVVSVPEPSTYAAILGFLALTGVMIRRRLRNR